MAPKEPYKQPGVAAKAALLVLLIGACIQVLARDMAMFTYWTGSGAPGQADYHLALARLALDASAEEFGPYQIEKVYSEMPTRRGRLALRSGDLDFHATTVTEFEAASPHFIIVPHPLEYGLLGYRNLLVRRDDLPTFRQMNKASSLKVLQAGLGRDWPDIQVLKDNDFAVKEAFNFPSLFPMLMARRFDYIPLGVEEIRPTLNAIGEQFPDIVVVDDVLLVYPMPMYFMVCACRPELARRLRVGLQKLEDSGEQERLFRRYKAQALERLNHHWRLVIELDNPRLPEFYQKRVDSDFLQQISGQSP